jgi:hypothetical protein
VSRNVGITRSDHLSVAHIAPRLREQKRDRPLTRCVRRWRCTSQVETFKFVERASFLSSQKCDLSGVLRRSKDF